MALKQDKKVNMMCRVYKLGFHPLCFTAYHNPDSVEDDEARTFLKDICPHAKNREVHKELEDSMFAQYPFQK